MSTTTYYSMSDIRRANKDAGQHWFEPDTLRFFASRVSETVYQGPGGIYFVSSEQFRGSGGYRAERLYSVRQFIPETGSVETVGEFNKLTKSVAHRRAKRCAEQAPEAASR